MEDEITSSAFLASVAADEPFRFQGLHAQVRSALRITHLALQRRNPQASDDAAPTFAMVRTLAGPSKAVETFTIAGFPASSGAAADNSDLVPASDIAAGLNVQFDVDEYTELIVQGPHTVLFFGEQFSQLIDEGLNHRMFDDEGDDDADGWMDEMYSLARD